MYVGYRHKDGFEPFFEKVAKKRVAVMYDVNTKPYAEWIIGELSARGAKILDVYYPDEELVPSEDKCEYAYAIAADAEYVLAVGSGTLNDMAKSVGTRRGVPSGVLATAASMDGYCSKGAALMRGGFKVTDEVRMPEDILIYSDIIKNAPRIMSAAGFGDIIGKYTCLADWRLSSIVNGEEIDEEAFSLMERARTECVSAFDGLVKNEGEAVVKLMDALIIAGTSMAMCGNSRPASGSEHHQSHFLEMDFVRRGEKIPMHGLKVAIGTLVSLELYNFLKERRVELEGNDALYALIEELPSVGDIKGMLEKMGCPTRFSQLGVREETMREMLKKAHTVRDRYTILTFISERGLTEDIIPLIMDKYY